MDKNCWLFLLCIGSLFSSGFGTPSIVAWSFDHREGSEIIPHVFEAVGNYRSDLSPLGTDYEAILPQGQVKQCVYVNGKTFNLASGLESNCLNDIDKCNDYFLMSFFLKIESWNDARNGVILRTTGVERNLPGLYVGRDGEKITVSVKGSSGKTYSKTFSKSEVWQKWGRVEIFFVGKLLLNVNDIDITDNERVTATMSVDSETFFDIVVGEENGPIFYLDEINVNFNQESIPHTTEIQTTPPTTQPTTGAIEIETTANITQSTAVTTKKVEVHTTATTATTTSPIEATEAIKPASTTEEHPAAITDKAELTSIGPKPGTDLSNIWIVVVIIGLALLVFVSCMVWLFCFRRKKKHSKYDVNNDQIEMNGDYVRASTIIPYQDSPHNTDDNQTDDEGHNKPLIKDPQTA